MKLNLEGWTISYSYILNWKFHIEIFTINYFTSDQLITVATPILPLNTALLSSDSVFAHSAELRCHGSSDGHKSDITNPNMHIHKSTKPPPPQNISIIISDDLTQYFTSISPFSRTRMSWLIWHWHWHYSDSWLILHLSLLSRPGRVAKWTGHKISLFIFPFHCFRFVQQFEQKLWIREIYLFVLTEPRSARVFKYLKDDWWNQDKHQQKGQLAGVKICCTFSLNPSSCVQLRHILASEMYLIFL